MAQFKKVLVTGGTGLIGKELIRQLQSKGYEVGLLSRSKRNLEGVKSFTWNTDANTIDPEAASWAEAVIHLAGAGIADEAWTEKRKIELVTSRVNATRLLMDAMKEAGKAWKAFISASAIGYYGFETTDHIFVESDPSPDSFLSNLCSDWEKEAMAFEKEGVRTVRLRVGVVLSPDGGALPQMSAPVRWGIGSPLGKGNQAVAWIHITDMVRLFLWGLENENLTGPFNGVAPEMVDNRAFTKVLAKVYKRPLLLPPIPAWAIRLVAKPGVADLALYGSRISSEKAVKNGFEFEFPKLEGALRNLIGH